MVFNKKLDGEYMFSKLTRDVGEDNYRLRGKNKTKQNKNTHTQKKTYAK